MVCTDASDFSESLRGLFVAAGNPTLRSASNAMGLVGRPMSDQRISDWRNSRHLPKDFQTVEPLLDWLTRKAAARGATDLMTAREWNALWLRRSESADRQLSDETTPPFHARPYPGLSALTAESSSLYFGRDRNVDDLIATIVRVAGSTSDPPIVVVTGPSGAGKSSLLRAGLAKNDRIIVRGTARPDSAPEDVVLAPRRAESVAVLVVDQFEELFSSVRDPRPRIGQYVDLARTEGLVVVLGVRSDYYDCCVQVPILATAWQKNSVIVTEMSDSQLRQVIDEPFKTTGGRVEPGLADVMITDLHAASNRGERAGRLPLLAHVLQATWARRANGRMTISAYRATGGVSRAVTDTAEEAWAGIPDDERVLAKNVLLALIHLGPDDRPVRRAVPTDVLVDRFGDRIRAITDAFVTARLVVADRDRLEFVHDVVLDVWPRLRQWIASDRDAQLLRQEIESSAQAWISADRDASFLLRRSNLARALGSGNRRFRPDEHELLSVDGRAFLRESSLDDRRRERLRRGASLAVTILVIVSLVAAAVALKQTDNVTDQRDAARYSALLDQVGRLEQSEPSISAQLLLLAHRERPDDTAVVGQLLSSAGKSIDTPLSGHTGAVYGVSYSPDGTMLASAGNDRTVRLWNLVGADGPRTVGVLGGFDNFVTSVAFDPHRPLLATGSGDGTARLWDISEPDSPRQLGDSLKPGAGAVYDVAFSPDGSTLATPSDDGSVTLWNIEDPQTPSMSGTPIIGHTGPVRTVAFAPDGTVLASGGDDRTVRLWNVSDPENISALGPPLAGLPSITHSVTFDSTGTRLAVTGDNGNAQLWDVADRHGPRVLDADLPGSDVPSWSIAFGPQQNSLAAAGLDGVVRRWEISDPTRPVQGERLSAVSKVQPGAFSLRYSPDGRSLAVGYADGTVRLWSLKENGALDRIGNVGGLGVDSSGTLLAATGDDGNLDLLDVSDGPSETPRFLSRTALARRVDDTVRVAVAPDGSIVATADGNGKTVQLWDTSKPSAPVLASSLTIDTRYTNELAFSPSGKVLATGDSDTGVRLWDVSDPSAPAARGPVISGPTDLVTDVEFGASGTVLAVSSNDRAVRIYDLGGADEEQVGIGPVSTIQADSSAPAAFTPDGDTLVVGGRDSVELWDVTDAASPARLSTIGPSDAASFAVSPKGDLMAVGTEDGRLLLDDISDRRAPRTTSDSIVNEADRRISEGEHWEAVFSSSGKTLLAAYTGTGSVRTIEYDLDTAVELMCKRIGTTHAQERWEENIDGVPYQEPCNER